MLTTYLNNIEKQKFLNYNKKKLIIIIIIN